MQSSLPRGVVFGIRWIADFRWAKFFQTNYLSISCAWVLRSLSNFGMRQIAFTCVFKSSSKFSTSSKLEYHELTYTNFWVSSSLLCWLNLVVPSDAHICKNLEVRELTRNLSALFCKVAGATLIRLSSMKSWSLRRSAVLTKSSSSISSRTSPSKFAPASLVATSVWLLF